MAPAFSSTGSSPSLPLVYHQKVTGLDGVHSLILNRPSARNALSVQLLSELDTALSQIIASGTPEALSSGSAPLRALIVQASTANEGGAFCAGADLVERREMSEDQVRAFISDLRRVFDKLHHFPVPTIAAMDGPALGGGLELALACDFRVAANKVQKLGFPEVRLGVIPGAGGTQRTPRLIGLTRAKELIYTGRTIDAHEASSMGLVDYVAPEGQTAVLRARELAKSLLSSAPLALRSAKAAISRGFELELPQGLELERSCYDVLLPTRDRLEALEAFKEKRPTRFTGE